MFILTILSNKCYLSTYLHIYILYHSINFSFIRYLKRTLYILLKILKNKMRSVHDCIPTFTNKDCARVFAKPLTTIFNLSLTFREHPKRIIRKTRMKSFISGDLSLIENYRSIALLINGLKHFNQT